MSIEKVREHFTALGIAERIMEFEVSSATVELAAKAVPIKSPMDLAVDEDKNVYIVDRDNNRIIALDPYYKLKFIIDTFKPIRLTEPPQKLGALYIIFPDKSSTFYFF